MFVVKFKQHGALNCEEQLFGPFADYMEAEDALAWLPMLYGQGGREWPKNDNGFDGERTIDRNGHRCIVELIDPASYYNGN